MHEVITHINSEGIANKAAVSKFFKGLYEGKYLVTAKKINKRSVSQNRYYFGCVIALIRDKMIELGNDVDSQLVHDFLKDRFNSKEIFSSNGTIIGCIGDSTTKLSKSDFEVYLSKVKQFAAEVLDIVIPDPNQPSVLFAEYDHETNTTIIS